MSRLRFMKNLYKMLIVLLFVAASDLWAIKLPDGTQAEISTFEKHANKKFSHVVFLEETPFEKPSGTFTVTEATFYESGALESYTCSSGSVKTVLGDLSVSEQRYSDENYNVVFFHEKGGIKQMYAQKFYVEEDYDDGVIAGLCTEDKSLITFYPDGKIESITTQLGKTLEDAHLINTKYGALVIFGKESYSWRAYKDYEYTITLYNSGKLKTTNLGTKPIFVEIPELGKLEISETLELWENGNVKRISFPKQRTFEVGDEIFSCKSLEFYDDGKSIHIVDDGELKFTKDGKIKKMHPQSLASLQESLLSKRDKDSSSISLHIEATSLPLHQMSASICV